MSAASEEGDHRERRAHQPTQQKHLCAPVTLALGRGNRSQRPLPTTRQSLGGEHGDNVSALVRSRAKQRS